MLIGFHFSKLLPYRCLSYAVIPSVRIALVRRKFYEQLSCPKFVRVDSESFAYSDTPLDSTSLRRSQTCFRVCHKVGKSNLVSLFFGGGTGQDWYLGKVNTRPPVLVDTHSLVEKNCFPDSWPFFFFVGKGHYWSKRLPCSGATRLPRPVGPGVVYQ